MNSRKKDGWYRKKLFAHFDSPLEFLDAEKFVTQSCKVKSHSFLPFLSFDLKKRRIKKDDKSRPIRYASHLDGYIFSYYAKILSERYEQRILQSELHEVVLAYRLKRGNNIDFAREAFGHIIQLRECVALGFDISSFFDSIDHRHLKQQWNSVIGVTSLPPDHYAVFKALTKYAFANRDACYERLGYSNSRIKKGGRICSIEDFRTKIRSSDSSLIEVNRKKHGIPQGSALSAVLANIYMMPFDVQMNQLARKFGGVYRRYSDDILFVVPTAFENEIRETVRRGLADLGGNLMIQDDKTLATHFVIRSDDKIVLRDKDRPFQYLGFTFDGERLLIREQTLARYWRRVKRGVEKAKKDSKGAGSRRRTQKLFRRKLFRRFTHLGRRNFISYAKRASENQAGLSYKESSTWKQVNKHWRKLEILIYGRADQASQQARSIEA